MLTVHQPRALTGIKAGFGYDIDFRMYPTFEERAAYAHRQAITVITSEDVITVTLLGTGRTWTASARPSLFEAGAVSIRDP